MDSFSFLFDRSFLETFVDARLTNNIFNDERGFVGGFLVEFEEDAFDEEDGGVKSLDICLGEGCLVGGLEVELEGVTLDEG